MQNTSDNQTGRPKAEWRKKLLELKNHTDEEISLTQLEAIAGGKRTSLSQTLSRIVTSRREAIYKTQEVYEAIKKKLEEKNI
jgi:hypothetical protein